MTPARTVTWAAPAILPLIVVALWAATAAHLASPLFPGPGKVLMAAGQNFWIILDQMGATLRRVLTNPAEVEQ